jgi:hypothetical protein
VFPALRAGRELAGVLRRPGKAAQLLGGSAGVTLSYALTLAGCLTKAGRWPPGRRWPGQGHQGGPQQPQAEAGADLGVGADVGGVVVGRAGHDPGAEPLEVAGAARRRPPPPVGVALASRGAGPGAASRWSPPPAQAARSQRKVRKATTKPTASQASSFHRSGQMAPGPWPKISAWRMPSSIGASGKASATEASQWGRPLIGNQAPDRNSRGR